MAASRIQVSSTRSRTKPITAIWRGLRRNTVKAEENPPRPVLG